MNEEIFNSCIGYFCIGVIWYRNVENSSKEQKNNEEINAIITDYAEQNTTSICICSHRDRKKAIWSMAGKRICRIQAFNQISMGWSLGEYYYFWGEYFYL